MLLSPSLRVRSARLPKAKSRQIKSGPLFLAGDAFDLATLLESLAERTLISFLEPIARELTIPDVKAPFQHGELPQSSYVRSGIRCVCSFVWLRGFTVALLNSGDRKYLAHHGWYIYVCFPAVPCF
jgi:hypothetical protein